MRRLVLFPILLSAFSVDARPLEDEAARILDEQRAKYGTPGMTAAAIDNGRVLFTIASGLRDREAGLPMTVDTLVPAASISKLFTAALVMQQVEAGKLSLDEPVNRYVPEQFWIRDAQGRPASSTLRQLLSHSSGLPVSWAGIARAKGQTVLNLEQHLSRGQILRHAPGTRIVYANDGFALAGFAAAKADNADFAALASQRFLEPLGMKHSTWESPWTLKDPALSAAYGGLMGGKDRSVHNDLTAALPAGGLITTAPDLTQFALMLLNKGSFSGRRILSEASIEQMWTMQAKQHPAMTTGFGLGFGIRQYRGHKIVWWDGGLAGAANRFLLVPDRGAAVIVLSNMSENAASNLAANRILDLLLPETGEQTALDKDLSRYAGRYRFYDSVDGSMWFLRYVLDLQFTVRNGKLWHESRLTGSGELIHTGPGRFRIQGSAMDGSEVFFDGDEVYPGFMRAVRVPFYAGPAALVVYALILIIVTLTALFFAGRHLWRRRNARPGRSREK